MRAPIQSPNVWLWYNDSMNRAGRIHLRMIWATAWLAVLLAGWLAPATAQAGTGAAADRPESPIVPGQVLVGLKVGAQPAALPLDKQAAVQALPALSAFNVALVSVPAGEEQQTITQLLASPEVVFAEPNYRVQISAAVIPNDPLWGPTVDFPQGQYAPPRIRADRAWTLTNGSPGVTVAVVDSGIDAGHPEFAGRLLPGYDFIEQDNQPQDACGHGTHVSGIIAANANNAQGIAGMDWQSKLLPVRVLDGDCLGDILGVASGIIWAADRGAKVINLSLGSFSPSALLEDAVFYAYSRGAAVISAAGNVGGLGVLYPAAYDAYVLGVGATDSGDFRYVFSSTGPAVDVVAPGFGILSTTPRGAFWFERAPEFVSRRYGLMTGTSMAAAYAAGAASLLLAHDPARFDTPDKLYEALRETAEDLGPPGEDDQFGKGILQVDAALDYIPTLAPTPTPVPAVTVEYDLLSTARCANLSYSYLPVGRNLSPYPAGNVLGIFDEDDSSTVSLPFSFPFGGKSYDQVTVSANGYLSFDGPATGGAYANSFIPGGGSIRSALQHFIAPYWDDLTTNPVDPQTGVYAAAYTNPQRFAVEWYKVGRMQEPKALGTTDDLLTFQAVLYATGEMRFVYPALSGAGSTGASATVGLEYNGGRAGVLYAFNRAGALRSGELLQFIPSVPGSGRIRGCLVTASFGPAGGTLHQPPFCLNIPAGLLPQDTTASIEVFSAFSPPFPGAVDLRHYADISLQPEPPAPLQPMPLVCYTYTARDVLLAGGQAANLFLAAYDPETRLWERLPTALIAAQNRLEAPVSHFSVFGVFASPPPKELPVTGTDQTRTWLILLAGAAGGTGLLACALRRNKRA